MKAITISSTLIMLSMIFSTISANPALTVGTWVNITPPDPHIAGEDPLYVSDIVVDPTNSSILYSCGQGLQKSTDGGSTWRVLGANGGEQFVHAFRLRIDPNNGNHLYLVMGLHGQGFFVSTDAGESWTVPAGWVALQDTIHNQDIYSIDVEQGNFNHILIAFHVPWANTTWYPQDAGNAGLVESRDGGATWKIHHPLSQWNGQYLANTSFLHSPSQNIGDSNTWMVTFAQGTGTGIWRTTNAGVSWAHVSNEQIIRTQVYRATNGMVYCAGVPSPLRSFDNGATWEKVSGAPQGYHYGFGGDGNQMYVLPAQGGAIYVSPDSNGAVWTPSSGQSFCEGANWFTFDPKEYIMYSAGKTCGLWALKVDPPNRSILFANAKATPSSIINNTNTSVKFSVDITGTGIITSVTLDVSAFGGSSATPMLKTNSSTYEALFTIPAGSASGFRSAVVTAKDNVNNTATKSIVFEVQDASQPILLSQGKSVTASSTQDTSFTPANVVDGSQTTRWASAPSDPQWISIDLGAVQTLSKVVLLWEAAYGSSYEIQVSNDGTNWTSVFTTTTGDGGTDNITFNQTNGRYVRMYGTKRATQFGYSLYEFSIYGPALTRTAPAYSSSSAQLRRSGRCVALLSFTSRTNLISNSPVYDIRGRMLHLLRESALYGLVIER